jgi:heme exporter protein B
MIAALVRRDLTLRLGRWGSVLLPVVFFLLVASLFPFAVGPEPKLLMRIAGGITWVAALLAALMPIETLFESDRADGTLDQLATRGIALEIVAVARMVSHWLTFGLPLLLAVPLAAALLNLAPAMLPKLAVGLAAGTPALAALGVTAAALTTGLRGAGALAGLLVLPLALPILIFGAGAMGEGDAADGALKLLAAASLFLVALSPFAAGAALRAALD